MDEAFDVTHIAEARALSTRLAAAPAAPLPAAEAVKSAVLTRNGMLTLLSDRVALVRKAAARVFRAFPETYREVTSTYERRRRGDAASEGEGRCEGEGGRPLEVSMTSDLALPARGRPVRPVRSRARALRPHHP